MKKYKLSAYAVLIIIIIIIIGIVVYKVYGQNNKNNDIKEKTLSEVKYLENKFLNLFNNMNNIEFENYKISSSKIKKEDTSDSDQNSESDKESSSGSSGSSDSSGSSEKESSSGSSDKESQGSDKSESSEENKKYSLEKKGILTSEKEIDWNEIKNQTENMYTLLSGITLDLYQIDINQQDILKFNSEYDNLTKAVKEENKNLTLDELSKLYNYLPIFIEKTTDDEKEKSIINIKNSILKAYSILDLDKWSEMSEYINVATEEITKMVTNIDKEKENKTYNINKTYININELQNAVNIKDKEIFLIKYKNVLEVLSNI